MLANLIFFVYYELKFAVCQTWAINEHDDDDTSYLDMCDVISVVRTYYIGSGCVITVLWHNYGQLHATRLGLIISTVATITINVCIPPQDGNA